MPLISSVSHVNDVRTSTYAIIECRCHKSLYVVLPDPFSLRILNRGVARETKVVVWFTRLQETDLLRRAAETAKLREFTLQRRRI